MSERSSATPLWPGFALIVVACVALLGLELYAGFAKAPQTARNRELVDHAFEVISTAQALELAVQDAERGQRGFVITGDAAYLEPYRGGIERAPLLLAKLKQLIADNPEQMARMPNLEQQVATKFAELKHTVDIRQTQGFEAARKVVETDIGLDAMRAITGTLDVVIATENGALKERLTKTVRDEEATQRLALTSGAVALVIIVVGFSVVARAATSIQRSERGRLESEQQLRLLVDGVRDYALSRLDTEGHIGSWNPGGARMTGYSAREIAGQHFGLLFVAEERQLGTPPRALETALRDGKFEAESQLMRKDESRFMANIVIDPLRDASSKLIGFALIVRDITERVQQQETLEKTRAALAQSQKMDALGQLTGGIAHDFNNLLQVIRGGIDMIQRRLKDADPALLRFIDTVRQSSDRAASLTQRLLAFTRRQPLNPTAIDANKLVIGMSDMLRRMLGESIAVETVLAGGLWWTSADSNQLESGILNLAVNARDAMPGGGKLTIETANLYLDEAYAAAHSEVMPGQYVMIAVSDNGTGMSPEVAAKAFEPFFTTKDIGQGTGLGLSQVFGFIKQSGGHVKIYSELGAGTVVKLYLPRTAAAVEAETGAPTDLPPAGSGSETILVVEDEQDVRDLTALMLHDLGYRVLVAATAQNALQLLEQDNQVDLLFTDVGLPDGVNGRQLVDEAKRRWPHLKVLFTTGYARNAIIHHGRLDPGVELIVKPFTQRDVAEKIRKVLETVVV